MPKTPPFSFFGMVLYLFRVESTKIFLKKKYLAYLALLAGWIIFCYWLYARELLPRFQGLKGTPGITYVKDLNLPLAFTWGSDVPLAGKGFSEWESDIKKADSLGKVLILTGYYFLDEQPSILLSEALAKNRVKNIVNSMQIDSNRILIRVLAKEINADVKSSPFEAIGIEQMPLNDVLRLAGDTIELCFPLKDSFNLPPFLVNQLNAWLSSHSDRKDDEWFIVGIADGSGIAESADMALDRAEVIQNILIQQGVKNEHIHLSTGQRINPNTIRNRCVIVYIE